MGQASIGIPDMMCQAPPHWPGEPGLIRCLALALSASADVAVLDLEEREPRMTISSRSSRPSIGLPEKL